MHKPAKSADNSLRSIQCYAAIFTQPAFDPLDQPSDTEKTACPDCRIRPCEVISDNIDFSGSRFQFHLSGTVRRQQLTDLAYLPAVFNVQIQLGGCKGNYFSDSMLQIIL